MQATMIGASPAMDYQEAASWRRNTSRGGVVRPPFGLDWIARLYFEPSHPLVGRFARQEGGELVVDPSLVPGGYDGIVGSEGGELVVRR
jgi:hypothetical protein